MRQKALHPFETIESALEYMVLLESVIPDVSAELDAVAAKAATERYGNGVRLALNKIKQLSFHVDRSRRILSELTLIRGVLTNDAGAREPHLTLT